MLIPVLQYSHYNFPIELYYKIHLILPDIQKLVLYHNWSHAV